MYRQTVRRRRAVLALLVALSLTLLTAYFGESAGGLLHTLQRGVLQVMAPIQEGTGMALKPLRDFAGWFDDTLDARRERDALHRERDILRRQVLELERWRAESQQLRRLLALDDSGLSSYQPVTARVIGRSPTVWHATINIDRGRVDGVRVNQPVISGDGLVGKVTTVTRGAAQVTLITDHTSGVSAKVISARDPNKGAFGILQAPVGRPNDLRLEFVSRSADLRKNDRVYTSGSRSNRLESLFPPGIPIGVIEDVDEEELAQFQRVQVDPFAELQRLDLVQVLTQRHPAGGERAESTP